MNRLTDRNKPGVTFWATMALVVVLAGYATAYLCMARRPWVFMATGHGPHELPPVYEIGGRDLDQEFWRAIFGPAHWADRRIRPEKWTVK